MDIQKPKFNIHVFGDSHSRLYGSKSLTDYICNVYYVGAITMFRIGRDKLLIDDLKKISKTWYADYKTNAKPMYKHLNYPDIDTVNKGDYVIFVFGEIDVRNHLIKQSNKQHKPIINIIKDLAESYVSTIARNKEIYPDVNLIIQSIMPPTCEKNVLEPTKDYPHYGTIEERVLVNKLLNTELKRLCEVYNIKFLDTTTYYENDNSAYPVNGLEKSCLEGELDKRIKDASVHVDMNYPEGYVVALKQLDIQSNVNHYPYRKVCKYPLPLNGYQREFYLKLRITHYAWIIIAILLLFVPYKYIQVPLTIWIITILLNILLSEGKCFWNYIEFRTSNCNDKSLVNELGMSDSYGTWIVRSIYALSIVYMGYRLYYKK